MNLTQSVSRIQPHSKTQNVFFFLFPFGAAFYQIFFFSFAAVSIDLSFPLEIGFCWFPIFRFDKGNKLKFVGERSLFPFFFYYHRHPLRFYFVSESCVYPRVSAQGYPPKFGFIVIG